tara:strand:+ start:10 stop:747 length:738 start_codon:yes stop_codon:yes gene_type:complete
MQLQEGPMAIYGLDAEDRFEASSRNVLEQLGIRLTVGHDFEEYLWYLAKARPDHRIGDPFNPDTHNMNRNNSAWIVGHDSQGRIMHTQALRLLPTGAEPVSEYFRQNFHGFAPSEMDIDYERSRYKAGPGAKRMKGRVVYSGETWVGGEPGQFRGTGISSILGRCAMLAAIKEFGAQYVIGFMTRPVAYKGFCLRMGFMHAEPLALRWYLKNQPDAMEAVMVYMSDEDIRFVLDLPSSKLETLAA